MADKKKILVADDDESMLNVYRRIFSDTGHQFSTASNMKAALQKLEGGEFDLLVTDYLFPDGTGTDLIKIFEEKHKGRKSLLVSGSTTAPEPGKYPSLVAFFEKPFQIKLFLETVEKALA